MLYLSSANVGGLSNILYVELLELNTAKAEVCAVVSPLA